MQTNPFADIPATPMGHFKLYFYAAVLHLIERVAQMFGSRQAALEHFPFLEGYYDELATQALTGLASENLNNGGGNPCATGRRAFPVICPCVYCAKLLISTTRQRRSCYASA